jgi:hypothetical protein
MPAEPTSDCWRPWQWLAALPLILGAGCVVAGPPFLSNDPDPPEIGQWEVILPTTAIRRPDGGITGEWTTANFNYGYDSRTQLSFALPVAYQRSAAGSVQSGLGDVMLEYKRRFGTDPEAGYFGINPAVSLPTGDAGRGLGRGNAVVQLPLLYLRSRGEWVGYADARYRWRDGEQRTSSWFIGTVLERRLTARSEVGVELYSVTAQAPAADATIGFDVGVRYTLAPNVRLIASAGRAYRGEPATTLLVGLKLFF